LGVIELRLRGWRSYGKGEVEAEKNLRDQIWLSEHIVHFIVSTIMEIDQK
jgi:hypothetical protein